MREKILTGNEIDIIMTGYTASYGISCILHNYEIELKENLSAELVEKAKMISDEVLRTKLDKAIAESVDSSAIVYSAGEGGIFKALWDMAEKYRTGIVADIKKIPVRQEYIEICEYYNINPYMLNAKGSHLIMTAYGNRMLRGLGSAGVRCALIGYTVCSNDRIIVNGEEKRYIDSRIEDELKKFGGLIK
ncbi:MAG: hypothetical protein HFH14_05220 [Lachnospiraceae bacterium]|nr:hypothetical protein [Lachnospiraceae bacterium]